METKIATTVAQYRDLNKILARDTADMCYPRYNQNNLVGKKPVFDDDCPAWSLSALLSFIYKEYYLTLFHDGVAWNINVISHDSNFTNHHYNAQGNTPIDACVNIIIRLKEKKLI